MDEWFLLVACVFAFLLGVFITVWLGALAFSAGVGWGLLYVLVLGSLVGGTLLYMEGNL